MAEYRGMPVVKAMAEKFKEQIAELKEKGINAELIKFT